MPVRSAEPAQEDMSASNSCLHALLAAVGRYRGRGAVTVHQSAVRFWNLPCSAGCYTNAQIDDSIGRRRAAFPWRAPLMLSLRARFSHPAGALTGTAGFGLWNDPFLMSDLRAPALPQALWFFYAGPESDMALAHGVRGWGWKAAAVNAANRHFLALAPLIPAAALLMRSRHLYHRCWPVAQRALGVAERPLDVDMTRWHTYELHHAPDAAVFSVDGEAVLTVARPPRARLGLVIWLDSQAMIVRPTGEIRHRLVEKTTAQWMDVAALTLTAPTS